MPLKMQLLSYNSRVGIPEDMDLSNKCDECGSENLKFTSLDEAMENMKDNNTTEKPWNEYVIVMEALGAVRPNNGYLLSFIRL